MGGGPTEGGRRAEGERGEWRGHEVRGEEGKARTEKVKWQGVVDNDSGDQGRAGLRLAALCPATSSLSVRRTLFLEKGWSVIDLICFALLCFERGHEHLGKRFGAEPAFRLPPQQVWRIFRDRKGVRRLPG